METATTEKNNENQAVANAQDVSPTSESVGTESGQGQKAVTSDKRPPREFKKNTRRPARRESRVKPEFDQKMINIRRVARVVTGGRRFSFSVAMVAGNRKGMVGVGLGKAGDTSMAIEKAFRDARKNMITVNLTKDMSIPHDITAKFSSSMVTLMPAPDRGMIAGSSVRTVLELAGVKDIGGKVRSGSKNQLNIARATVAALAKLPKAKSQPEAKDAK